MERSAILSEKEIDTIIKYVDSQHEQAQMLSNHTLALHRNSPVQILLPVKEVKNTGSSYRLIKGRAVLENGTGFGGKIELDCYVACGNWNKLGDIKGEHIDVIESLGKLLPSGKRGIGLFTYQNGIQNGSDDCKQMGASIISKLQLTRPLCIGLYNKTNGKGYGIVKDLDRLMNEWTLNVNSMLFMRQLCSSLSTRLPLINPHLFWTHIAHSEAGLIASSCLTNAEHGLFLAQKEFLKRHFISLIYGGVSPMPDALVLDSINTYSNKDIALKLVMRYLDKIPNVNLSHINQQIDEVVQNIHKHVPSATNKSVAELTKDFQKVSNALYIDKYPHVSTKNGYKITVVDSIAKEMPFVEGDHAFLGATYQKALKDNLETLRTRWGII